MTNIELSSYTCLWHYDRIVQKLRFLCGFVDFDLDNDGLNFSFLSGFIDFNLDNNGFTLSFLGGFVDFYLDIGGFHLSLLVNS